MAAASSSTFAAVAPTTDNFLLETGEQSFDAGISLGSICLCARFLHANDIRKQTFPFDWGYSSPRMVRHCISTNFRDLLAKGMLRKFKDKRGTGHRLYEKMQLNPRLVVWPHHVMNETDEAAMQRAINRFEIVMKDPTKRKLLILTQAVTSQAMWEKVSAPGPQKLPVVDEVPIPEMPDCSLASVEEVRLLYEEIKKYSKGDVHMDVVYILQPGVSQATTKPWFQKVHTEIGGPHALTIYEMHCVGPNTGLFFKEEKDHNMLYRMVIQGRSFNIAQISDHHSATGMSDDLAAQERKRQRALAQEKARKKKLKAKAKGKAKAKAAGATAAGKRPASSSRSQSAEGVAAEDLAKAKGKSKAKSKAKAKVRAKAKGLTRMRLSMKTQLSPKAKKAAAKASGKEEGAKPKAQADSSKQKLAFVQENPKQPGSLAYTRYQKYKKATTVEEFYKLGGTRVDLAYDASRGFLKYRR